MSVKPVMTSRFRLCERQLLISDEPPHLTASNWLLIAIQVNSLAPAFSFKIQLTMKTGSFVSWSSDGAQKTPWNCWIGYQWTDWVGVLNVSVLDTKRTGNYYFCPFLLMKRWGTPVLRKGVPPIWTFAKYGNRGVMKALEPAISELKCLDVTAGLSLSST